MKQYEYLTYKGNVNDPELMGQLNDLGMNGWELVNVIMLGKMERYPENMYYLLYMFKREVITSTKKQLLNEEKIHE